MASFLFPSSLLFVMKLVISYSTTFLLFLVVAGINGSPGTGTGSKSKLSETEGQGISSKLRQDHKLIAAASTSTAAAGKDDISKNPKSDVVYTTYPHYPHPYPKPHVPGYLELALGPVMTRSSFYNHLVPALALGNAAFLMGGVVGVKFLKHFHKIQPTHAHPYPHAHAHDYHHHHPILDYFHHHHHPHSHAHAHSYSYPYSLPYTAPAHAPHSHTQAQYPYGYGYDATETTTSLDPYDSYLHNHNHIHY